MCKVHVVAASIVGAALVHAALTACGSDGTANAQNAPATCSQWQYTEVNPSDFPFSQEPNEPGAYQPTLTVYTAPAGWEPFAVNSALYLRRCSP